MYEGQLGRHRFIENEECKYLWPAAGAVFDGVASLEFHLLTNGEVGVRIGVESAVFNGLVDSAAAAWPLNAILLGIVVSRGLVLAKIQRSRRRRHGVALAGSDEVRVVMVQRHLIERIARTRDR